MRAPGTLVQRASAAPLENAGRIPISLAGRRARTTFGRSEQVMYPSMLKTSGDLFADFEALQDRLDELLAGRTSPSSIRAVGRAGAFPALNIGTWAEAVEIYAFAPGIDPKSIELSVEKGLLTLSGERKASARAEGDKVNVYARERYSGPFRRVVSLPDDSDPERVEASYRNGVLKIVVPKRESAKPRQIAVSSAA
jgi:HSP20 family protein